MTDDLLHDLLTAERGSRELDARFALALGAPQEYFNSFDTDIDGFPFEGFAEVEGPECYFDAATWGGGGRSWTAPHYTTNMQDTIEAVPEGWSLKLIIHPDITYAELYLLGEYKDGNRPILRQYEDEACKPQLAACAAILKAKGAQDGS